MTDPGMVMPPSSPRDHHASQRFMRRLERAFSQINPILVAVAAGLIVLDLTCLVALTFPVSHLTACVAPPAASATGEVQPNRNVGLFDQRPPQGFNR